MAQQGFVDAAAYDALAVTPSDSQGFAKPSRGLYVGTTGDVSIHTVTGNDVLFKSVPAGMILPIGVQRVNNTNTTASNIVAFF